MPSEKPMAGTPASLTVSIELFCVYPARNSFRIGRAEGMHKAQRARAGRGREWGWRNREHRMKSGKGRKCPFPAGS